MSNDLLKMVQSSYKVDDLLKIEKNEYKIQISPADA